MRFLVSDRRLRGAGALVVAWFATFSSALSANAESMEWEVGTLINQQYLQGSNMDSVTAEDGYIQAGFYARMSLPTLLPIPKTLLSTSIRFGFGAMSGESFNQIESEFSSSQWNAGLRASYLHLPWIQSFAEMEVGAQNAELKLESSGSTVQSSDRGILGTASVGGEFRLGIPKRDWSLRLQLALGYQLASSLNFQATPMSQGDDRIPIDVQSAGLGKLNNSGPILKFGLGLQF